MQTRRYHWWIAVSLAIVVHLALAVSWPNEPVTGTTHAGMGGIEIGLGPANPQPSSETQKTEQENPEPEPAPKPEPEPESEPKPKPEPEPAEPEPEPDPETRAKQPATSRQPQTSVAEKQTDSEAPAIQGDNASGGGIPGADQADYAAQLRAWLERHRRYPRKAQLRRQEGVAVLYFVVDRSGQVLDYRIQQSSGYRILDREVKEMLKRAQPLPEIPEEFGRERVELLLPIQFRVR